MTDESILGREAIPLAQSEEDLLESLILEHSRVVYRIAFSVLRQPQEAEDATQETFLRVLRYRSKLPFVEDRKAWLAQIAWRVAIDSRRKTIRKREDELAETPYSAPVTSAAAMPDPQQSAMLDRLIDALPDQLRHPLVLSAVQEMSPREVASVLEISEAAVRSRVFRAKQILRDRILGLTTRGKS